MRAVTPLPSKDVEMVPRLWPDSTVTCIGGGPSLTVEDVNACFGRTKVIAINDAYRVAPWADVLYACDALWWRWHQGVQGFMGLKYALTSGARRYGVEVLKIGPERGLALDPGTLCTGQNSGYQAINLAVHLGAKRILLLGYDMKSEKGRPTHWFGEHPGGGRTEYQGFVQHFDSLIEPLRELGVEVINCSRETALECFPRQPLHQALNQGVQHGPLQIEAGEVPHAQPQGCAAG